LSFSVLSGGVTAFGRLTQPDLKDPGDWANRPLMLRNKPPGEAMRVLNITEFAPLRATR